MASDTTILMRPRPSRWLPLSAALGVPPGTTASEAAVPSLRRTPSTSRAANSARELFTGGVLFLQPHRTAIYRQAMNIVPLIEGLSKWKCRLLPQNDSMWTT